MLEIQLSKSQLQVASYALKQYLSLGNEAGMKFHKPDIRVIKKMANQFDTASHEDYPATSNFSFRECHNLVRALYNLVMVDYTMFTKHNTDMLLFNKENNIGTQIQRTETVSLLYEATTAYSDSCQYSNPHKKILPKFNEKYLKPVKAMYKVLKAHNLINAKLLL